MCMAYGMALAYKALHVIGLSISQGEGANLQSCCMVLVGYLARRDVDY